jgi:hypothetical protein
MARGWESKAVEAQQEEATRRAGPRLPEQSDADRERVARCRTLELARARAQADLGKARSDVHRATLQRTVAALDEEIQRLQ